MNILSLPRRTDPQSLNSVFIASSASNQQTYGVTWDSLVQSMSDAIGGDFIAGNDMQIQYNSFGEFAADPNFAWDYSSQILNITGTVNVSGPIMASGAVTGQSFNGASITNSQPAGVFLNGTGGYSVPKPLAGIAGDKQVIVNILGNYQSNVDFTWDNDTKILNVTGDITATTFNGVALTTGGATTNFLNETGAYSAIPAPSAAGSDTQLQFNSAGSLGATPNMTWDGSSLNASAFNGVALTNGGATTDFLNAAGSYSAVPISAGGNNTEVQFNSAGSFSGSLNFTYDGTILNVGLGAGGAITADTFNGVSLVSSGSTTSYLSEDGSYTVPAGVIPAGANNQVQFNDAGVFGVDANFTWDGVTLTRGLDQVTLPILTPPILVANVDDYNPVGFDNTNLLRMESDNSNYRVTGFQAPPAGVNRIITIINIGINGDRVDLRNNDANSLPANRMLLRGNINIQDDRVIQLWYDHVDLRWRVLSEGT